MELCSVISVAGIWDERPMKDKQVRSCKSSCSSARRKHRILQLGFRKDVACAAQVKHPVAFGSKELTLHLTNELMWPSKHPELLAETLSVNSGWVNSQF